MGRSSIEQVFHGFIAVAALAVAASMVKREFFGPTAPGQAPPIKVDNWSEISAGHLRRGPDSAPVTIVEFADFECPACKAVAPIIERVRRKYPADVNVVFRHFPLSYHQHAKGAALAAECAGRQGAFGSMHDSLYAQQSELGRKPFETIAREADVPDSIAFAECMNDGRDTVSVNIDAALASRIGAAGTPTFVINGMLYSRNPTEAELDALIAARSIKQ
ncbi:MAG TPA: DsbA family protein [Gemmatimonadales bacterium]|nr:DsbA family protein [Gemmatimonadales bacterium]